MDISQEYVIQKFYQYAGYVKHQRSKNIYEAGCPICREGKSWGRKRRLYYLVKDAKIFCHNCGFAGGPIKFIMEAGNMEYDEVLREIRDGDFGYISENQLISNDEHKLDIPRLPKDCINLTDEMQISFYKCEPNVKKALEFIKRRRLDTAVNRPDTLWISLSDYTHKNRLVIPFYDDRNNIVYYQSRTLDNDPCKYISKTGGYKTLFNLDKVTSDSDNVYIFEGPIDAFFVKNSIAVGGINENSEQLFTRGQEEQLSAIQFFDFIWVLDSQYLDKASHTKTNILIEKGHKVFIWPRELGTKFKDFNDICVLSKRDEIQHNFINRFVFSGMRAKAAMSGIRQPD